MKNKGLIIGIIVGVVVIAGALVTLFLTGVLGGGGSYPTNLTEFRKAIEDKTAINCTISMEGEDGELVYQANDGWTMFRMSGTTEGTSVETLLIEGDAVYMVMGDMAIKNSAKTSSIDEFVGDFTGDDITEEDEAKTTLKCSSPNGNNFTVPDKNWIDMSAFGEEE